MSLAICLFKKIITNGGGEVFKKRRGIHIPYNKQGLIYFTCMNYKDMPGEVQQKIRNLCRDITTEHCEALFKVLTDSDETIRSVSFKYHVSETQLYFYRKKFYEKF